MSEPALFTEQGTTHIEVADVIRPQTLEVIHSVIAEEFGSDNIVSSVIFGSTVRSCDKKNSDYDFTLVVRNLSQDISSREEASPRMKRRLAELGVDELCAFNIYTPEEMQGAFERRLWLLETMKTGYVITHDTDNFVQTILEACDRDVERVETKFAWQGVEFVNTTRFTDSIRAHLDAATVLESSDVEMAAVHRSEAERQTLTLRLYEHGEAHSRGSSVSLAKRLVDEYGEDLDLVYYQLADLDHEMKDKRTEFGYDMVDRHLDAAHRLYEDGQYTMSLSHTLKALRNTYLHALHLAGHYIIDGEVTQLFLRSFRKSLTPEVVDAIYENSFRAEQFLGRSGFLSFDLVENGKPYYEEIDDPSFNFGALQSSLVAIIDSIRHDSGLLATRDDDATVVTIVVSSKNVLGLTSECEAQLNKLIFPTEQMEVVVRQANGESPDDVFPLDSLQSEYVVLMDDNTVLSPLSLINLLAGFKNDGIDYVTSNVTGHEDQVQPQHVTCYRRSALQGTNTDKGTDPTQKALSHYSVDGEPIFASNYLLVLTELSRAS